MENTRGSYSNAQKLAGCGILLAISIVLSLIKGPMMPEGGSVTACSALPIIIAAYKYGTRWGVTCGAALGIINLMFDPGALKGISLAVVIASIILDYMVAHGVLGLAGLFRPVKGGFVIGAFTVMVLKYAVHFISGIVLWGSFAPTGTAPWLYSVIYNGTYMVPEIIITTVAAALLFFVKPLSKRIL